MDDTPPSNIPPTQSLPLTIVQQDTPTNPIGVAPPTFTTPTYTITGQDLLDVTTPTDMTTPTNNTSDLMGLEDLQTATDQALSTGSHPPPEPLSTTADPFSTAESSTSSDPSNNREQNPFDNY